MEAIFHGEGAGLPHIFLKNGSEIKYEGVTSLFTLKFKFLSQFFKNDS